MEMLDNHDRGRWSYPRFDCSDEIHCNHNAVGFMMPIDSLAESVLVYLKAHVDTARSLERSRLLVEKVDRPSIDPPRSIPS